VRKSSTAPVSFVAAVVMWSGVAQPATADRPDWAGGQAAVSQLGERLPAVAARNSLSPGQLRSNFLSDPTLLVDAEDQLLYIEPLSEQADAAESAEAAAGAAAAGIDPAAALTLHSKPGSARVIYLDFDGQTVVNTAWNSKTGGACYADPYDSDGVPGAFSQAELTAIAGVWARVAEDYAPFDVDVTTVDPGAAAITRTSQSDSRYGTRVLVTRSVSVCPNGKTLYASVCTGGCGGIAYVGVFDQTGNHAYYQPALVFQNGVGSGQKNVAEAAAHEAGHNLGLSHDGNAASAYYSGHGSWAPIMGVGYYKAITQWSRGEYAGATQTQDDLAVMQSNGARTLRDDYPDNKPQALTAASAVTGIISTRSDADVFAVTVSQQSTITVTATPAATSPNLDIALTPGGFGGGVTVNPRSGSTSVDVATGMDASISATVAPGTYTVRIDGGGAPAVDAVDTGYSDYASLGAYTVSLTVT
jgi:hypothetical protein